MTIGELLIRLGIDSTGATKGLSETESKVKGSMGNVGKHFDEAGTHVSKFGGIMSGIGMGIGMGVFNLAADGIGKVVGVLGDAEKAYQDAAVSQAQLNTSIDNNITATGDQTITTQATADALDKTMQANLRLGFSMDEQRASMALLLGVTHDTYEAQKLQTAAMDLARLKGVDLATATGVLMKAAEGNTKGLKAYGITVVPVTAAVDALKASTKKYTAEQMAAANAADKAATVTAMLGDVTALSKGQADAFAETSAGKLAAGHAKVTEAMVKLGSIMDKITQVALPALADAFSGVMDAVGPVLDQLGQDMPAIIATVETAIQGLEDALSPITTALGQELPGAIATVRAAIDSIIPSFGGGGAGGAATGLSKDIEHLRTTFSGVFADIQSIVSDALNILKNGWQTFGGDITKYLQIVIAMWEGIFNGVMTSIQGIFDVFAALFKGDWQGVWKGIQEIFAGFVAVIGSMFKGLMDVIPVLLDAGGKIVGGIWSNILHGLETAAQAIGNAIMAAFHQYIVKPIQDGFNSLVGFVTGIPGQITKAATGMFDGIWGAFKAAINQIIRGWNSLEFKFGGIDMGPLGKMAAFDLRVPQIPYLHSGGIVPGVPGSDVLAMLQAGERVTPRGQAQQTGTTNVTINNPTPEPASTSLQDSLLRLVATGYLPKPQGAY